MIASVCILASCMVAVVAAQEETIAEDDNVVTSPPRFVAQPPQSQPYRLEQKIVLQCHAEGEPQPTYTWKKNGIPYNPGEQDNRAFISTNSGTLNILRTNKLDQGDYQCTASNGFGSAVSEKCFLRQAVLASFDPEPAIIKYVNVGDPLTLRCTPPSSFPKGQYYWSYKDESKINSAIDYSPRVVVDLEGNLHFSNVLPSDERAYICVSSNEYLRTLAMSSDVTVNVRGGNLRFTNVLEEDGINGAPYSCGVHNIVLRKTVLGGETKIVVNSGSGTIPNRDVALMFAVGSQNFVGLVGETTVLQCVFSGYPTPNVQWEYERTPDKVARYKIAMHSTQLEIYNTQESDRGQITCSATNTNTDRRVTHNFNLNVQSKPFFVRRPEPVNAAEEEDADFYCVAKGNPSPSIQWFIDGVPIAQTADNPRRTTYKDRVSYHMLSKADVGVLQCNASNTHGWVFANAFLNVLADPPSIIDRLPSTMKFPDGKTITIPCNTFGAPKPIISWTKDTRELTGGRFVTMADGGLKIERIQATDAGMYRCLARNKFGEAADSTTVAVRRPTRIKVPPQATTVVKGKEAKFTCEAETDPLEDGNLVISWRKDGQDINYGSTQRISTNTWDNSVLISGTDALDTGLYTCVATNGLDEDTASARLIVQAEPEPPTGVKIETCGSREARIRWQGGQPNNAPILNYIVEFNTTHSPWQVVNSNVSSAQTDVVVPLSPWGDYKFRVLARNIIGTSLPSEPTATPCTTPADKPDNNPDNVRTIDRKKNALIIAWSPMPIIEQNGPNMHYSVIFERLDVNSAPNTTRIEDPRVYELLHEKNVPIYAPYKITVKAVNGFGNARETPTPIIGFSGESHPTQTVSDFRVVKNTVRGKTATFQWSGVDESTNLTQGFFRGYRITFWKSSEPDSKRRLEIIQRDPKDETLAWVGKLDSDRKKRALGSTETQVVDNLPPFSNVNAYVQVINKNYAGKPSNTVTFKTEEGVPGPPINLKMAEVGPNHVTLSWSPPDEPNGRILGYHVEYQKVNQMTQDTRQQRRPQIDNPIASEAKVGGLESRQKYIIFLSARTSEGLGEETFIEVMTDSPGAPGKPSMKIVSKPGTVLNVTWTPSVEKGKKPASSFYAQYRKTESTEWQRTPYESDLYWANITNLDPGYTYEVRVVASNGPNYETESDSENVYIPDTREIAGSVTNVAGASWFIALMCIIALFVLILIIVCVIRQNRGEKYPVIEKEMLRGQPMTEDNNFGEFVRPEEPYRKSQGSLNSDVKPGMESDTDSMAAYDDDPSKFNEDGSFIGQYGAKKQPPPDPDGPAANSAMSTFV